LDYFLILLDYCFANNGNIPTKRVGINTSNFFVMLQLIVKRRLKIFITQLFELSF